MKIRRKWKAANPRQRLFPTHIGPGVDPGMSNLLQATRRAFHETKETRSPHSCWHRNHASGTFDDSRASTPCWHRNEVWLTKDGSHAQNKLRTPLSGHKGQRRRNAAPTLWVDAERENYPAWPLSLAISGQESASRLTNRCQETGARRRPAGGQSIKVAAITRWRHIKL